VQLKHDACKNRESLLRAVVVPAGDQPEAAGELGKKWLEEHRHYDNIIIIIIIIITHSLQSAMRELTIYGIGMCVPKKLLHLLPLTSLVTVNSLLW